MAEREQLKYIIEAALLAAGGPLSLDAIIELFTEDFFRVPPDLPPGEVVAVDDSITLSADMRPGLYQLSIAVVGETSDQPAVRLGIRGRGEDGWYRLSDLRITR